MIKLNIRQAMDLALLAIAERGEDYVYAPPEWAAGSCVYYDFDNGVPSCAVGLIMDYVGFDPDLYDKYDWNDDKSAEGLLSDLAELGLAEVDEQTKCFLEVFQHRQDTVHFWGDCYRQAVQEVNFNFDTDYSTEIIKPEISVEELREQVTIKEDA